MSVLYPYGQKEVAVTDNIAIFTEGQAKVYYKNTNGIYYYSSTVNNEEVVLTPGVNVRIDSTSAEKVYYEIGASPVIDKNSPDFVGSTDPLSLTGKTSSTTIGSSGGDAELVGADATAGTTTTAGGIGGDSDLTAGAGGAKTDTGAADGGAGGASSVTAGVGGATAASAATEYGGAGGIASVTAGTGGAASAGTANGGNGGNVVITQGTGGASAGGTAGYDGLIRFTSNYVSTQGTPAAETAAATISAADLKVGIVTITQSTGSTVVLTLDTGAYMDTAFPSAEVDDAIDWYLINLSAAAADTGTVTASSGHTIVGEAVVESAHADSEFQSSGHFRSRRTAANTWVTYRLS